MRMMQNPFFNDKKILVVDLAPKTANDRTWCFWETQPGLFEPVVHHHWRKLNFYSENFSSPIDITPYEYKMIRGIDFYGYVLQKAQQNTNIQFLYAKIQSIGKEGDLAFVTAGSDKFYASFVFNSLSMPISPNLAPAGAGDVGVGGSTNLLQHFKGWLIETPDPLFDDKVATFMDFRVHQRYGTTFVYVLPVAPNKALVEYTLVSETVLPSEAYNAGLEDYICNFITKGSYTITEEEFGVIPMTDYQFPPGDGNIVNIGTAGGQTKASSGFTFQFIQKQSAAIVEALVNNKHPLLRPSFFQKRFRLYDSILLHIIQTGKMPGAAIFARLFKKIPAKTIFRFLDNDTTVLEELMIMASMPAGIFLPTAIAVSMKR